MQGFLEPPRPARGSHFRLTPRPLPSLPERSILGPQALSLLGKSSDIDSEDVTEEWNPPISEYPFVERARIADAFFGPDAESIDEERTLARRIQVIGDLAALCKLRQPSRRGKPFNWSKEEKTVNGAILKVDDLATTTFLRT